MLVRLPLHHHHRFSPCNPHLDTADAVVSPRHRVGRGCLNPPPRRAATASPLTIDLFIRTYTGDAHRLIYLLRSFERFLHPSAYRTLHVVTDDGADAEFVTPIVSLFPALRARVVGQTVERWMTSHNNVSYHAQVWAWVLGGKEGGGETASWAPTHPPTHPPTLHTDAVQTQRRLRRGRR